MDGSVGLRWLTSATPGKRGNFHNPRVEKGAQAKITFLTYKQLLKPSSHGRTTLSSPTVRNALADGRSDTPRPDGRKLLPGSLSRLATSWASSRAGPAHQLEAGTSTFTSLETYDFDQSDVGAAHEAEDGKTLRQWKLLVFPST